MPQSPLASRLKRFFGLSSEPPLPPGTSRPPAPSPSSPGKTSGHSESAPPSQPYIVPVRGIIIPSTQSTSVTVQPQYFSPLDNPQLADAESNFQKMNFTQILTLVLQALLTRNVAFAFTLGTGHYAATITQNSTAGNSGSFVNILQILGQVLAGNPGTWTFGVFSLTIQKLITAPVAPPAAQPV